MTAPFLEEGDTIYSEPGDPETQDQGPRDQGPGTQGPGDPGPGPEDPATQGSSAVTRDRNATTSNLKCPNACMVLSMQVSSAQINMVSSKCSAIDTDKGQAFFVALCSV